MCLKTTAAMDVYSVGNLPVGLLLAGDAGAVLNIFAQYFATWTVAVGFCVGVIAGLVAVVTAFTLDPTRPLQKSITAGLIVLQMGLFVVDYVSVCKGLFLGVCAGIAGLLTLRALAAMIILKLHFVSRDDYCCSGPTWLLIFSCLLSVGTLVTDGITTYDVLSAYLGGTSAGLCLGFLFSMLIDCIVAIVSKVVVTLRATLRKLFMGEHTMNK